MISLPQWAQRSRAAVVMVFPPRRSSAGVRVRISLIFDGSVVVCALHTECGVGFVRAATALALGIARMGRPVQTVRRAAIGRSMESTTEPRADFPAAPRRVRGARHVLPRSRWPGSPSGAAHAPGLAHGPPRHGAALAAPADDGGLSTHDRDHFDGGARTAAALSPHYRSRHPAPRWLPDRRAGAGDRRPRHV